MSFAIFQIILFVYRKFHYRRKEHLQGFGQNYVTISNGKWQYVKTLLWVLARNIPMIKSTNFGIASEETLTTFYIYNDKDLNIQINSYSTIWIAWLLDTYKQHTGTTIKHSHCCNSTESNNIINKGANS